MAEYVSIVQTHYAISALHTSISHKLTDNKAVVNRKWMVKEKSVQIIKFIKSTLPSIER